ncbi:hypothetical protein MNBD_ALPHA05-1482 [hydrothermal vent metagenome]|uniref:Uncharacterized protein n=1 Tax=hydrothermal vent metagenome TaxID=652676 RepID=A0A3B0TBE1_9ZZZZ
MLDTLSAMAAAPISFGGAILMQPLWLQAWVGWLMLANLVGAVVFIRRPEAKWVLAAIVPAAISMIWLYSLFGFQRILGLAHVAFWTPLMFYLWSRRTQWNLSVLSGKWLAAVFVTDVTSLVIDYADVVRYLAGERL